MHQFLRKTVVAMAALALTGCLPATQQIVYDDFPVPRPRPKIMEANSVPVPRARPQSLERPRNNVASDVWYPAVFRP